MNHRHALFVGALMLLSAPLIFAEEIGKVTEGRLDATGSNGQSLGVCPLKHTTVEAEISGTIAQVTVTQQFHNPYQDKIEAIYVFPLHQDSAVDDMTMTVGDRVVKGIIKERSEAAKIYNEAKTKGKVASLLDQERPNIFTQSVANIEPGQEVTITTRYSQTLDWKDGRYAFDFPTVVGPRYIPGGESSTPSFFRKPQPKRGPAGDPPVVNPNPVPPTAQVPDANRITPPIVEEGYRAGHDISITVRIHAGLPISDLKSALHEIKIENPDGDPACAVVRLSEKSVIPNKDFAISYRTAGDKITDAVLTHTDERGKFFTLVLQPPARVKQDEVVPRELIFVLDTSGSMTGFPIETSKAMMRRAIANLRPLDRFNLVKFAGDCAILFPNPVENTEKNRHKALGFIDNLHGSGGTEMMKAINTALGAEHDPHKVRIVCFLTDGYVGNDMEIVAAVKKHAGISRVFSFGIGDSVNRFLLDEMAHAGRGEAHYVLNHEEAKKSADTFYERIDAPVLTDITLDFGGLAVEEVYPQSIGDLFAAKPVVVKGRYSKAGTGVIKLKGSNAAGSYERELTVTLPEEFPENQVLASQWARAKVEHLMMQDMGGLQQGKMKDSLKEDIIKLGINYHLMTQFTSFVAVEEQRVTEGGVPRTIQVPIEMPEGVSYSGVFGNATSNKKLFGLIGSSGFSGGNGYGGGKGFGAGLGGGGGSGSGLSIPQTCTKRFSKADRLQRLNENGGSLACEEAVVKSLDWLKSHQNKDGSWCASKPTSMTAMALLTYLGHAETPISEQYGETVLKAMVFLIEKSAKNQGKLADDLNDTRWPYEHAVATFALAEACADSKQLLIQIPGIEDAVRKAGQWIIDHPAQDSSDVLLIGAQLQALKACSQNKIPFKGLTECIKIGLVSIQTPQNADGSIGRDTKGDVKNIFCLTGAGALGYQQWSKGAKVSGKACHYLAKNSKFAWSAADADLPALHVNAQAMLNHGGKEWTDFNAMFLPEVLAARNQDGTFKDVGGASAAMPLAVSQQFRGEGELAVHYRTCLATLILEVYYRDIPKS
ncbi:MAG: VIT domain-containing protein [Verrucomicrobiota bacterium]